MSGNVHEIANILKGIVETSGRVLGARLAAELKARVPNWSAADFGVRNLREFVTTYVTDVVIAGRSGMDVIYALASAPPIALTTSQTPVEVDFWRVWASPNSPHALAIERASGAVRVVPRRSHVSADHVLVEPLSADSHREVANAFLPNVSPALRAKLQAVIDGGSDSWWQAWLRELRGSASSSTWSAFRRQQLEDRLMTRLRDSGFEQASIDEALSLIRERHAAATAPSRRALISEASFHDGSPTLRRIVIEAVQHMSDSELRELRIPFGIVFDVLTTSKGR